MVERAVKGDLLSLRWRRLDNLVGLTDNHKLHDIGAICASIRSYGFKDPLKIELLLNGGVGGVVEGNGRLEALQTMYKQGTPTPDDIYEDSDGMWLIPVVEGVDAPTEEAARAYALEHNLAVLGGRIRGLTNQLKMFDEGVLDEIVALAAEGFRLETLSATDLDAARLLLEEGEEFDAEGGATFDGEGATRRVVLIFESEADADEAFARLGMVRTPGQVIYQWEDYERR